VALTQSCCQDRPILPLGSKIFASTCIFLIEKSKNFSRAADRVSTTSVWRILMKAKVLCFHLRLTALAASLLPKHKSFASSLHSRYRRLNFSNWFRNFWVWERTSTLGLISEIETAGGIAWVTEGREIENEIQKDIFETGCKKIGRSSAADLDDKYADRLVRADDRTKQIDKIRLARAIIELTHVVPDSSAGILQKIVSFVKSATLKSV
jgi:hypothetical protein